MCAICHQTPCHPACPNAPEPKPIYYCAECGEGIYDGDRYFECQEGCVCEECMDDMSAEEILELLGEKFKIAV